MLHHDKPDNLTFQALVDNARRRITDYYPAWTDQNAHDPGMMLIELFAWLTEMMRFCLEQSDEYEALFPLLGIARRQAKPAVVHVRVIPDGSGSGEPLPIPQGTPMMAEDILFESESPFICEYIALTAVTADGRIWENSQLAPLFPFGEDPQPGNHFSVYLDAAFEPGRSYTLEIVIQDQGRNPVDPDKPPPLAQMVWEYLATDGYVLMDTEDMTYGFIESGLIRFTPHTPMLAGPDGRYELRCSLIAHEYDIAPRFDALRLSVFRAWQRETLCEDILCVTEGDTFSPGTYLSEQGDNMLFLESSGEYVRIPSFTKQTDPGGFAAFTVSNADFPADAPRRFHMLNCEYSALSARVLGEARGFPNQRYPIDIRDGQIVYDDFSLWVGDSHAFNRASQWYKVDNFFRSSPTDRHYTLDAQSGEIHFGDGLQGAMPKGVVLAASLSLTLGAGGNITSRQLNVLRCGDRLLPLEQPLPASGGCERENVSEAAARMQSRLERVVTAADFEKSIREIPGLIIDRVNVYAGGSMDVADPFDPYRVIAAVKPPGSRARLSEAYQRHIREHLEPYRMAGCEIEIVTPHYTRLDILAEVEAYPYRYGMTSEWETRLKAFFERVYGGFGVTINKMTLIMELSSYPQVKRVISLDLRAVGGHERDARGLILRPYALAYWGGIDWLLR